MLRFLFIILIILFSLPVWAVNLNLKKNIVFGGQVTVNVKLIDMVESSTDLGDLAAQLADIKFTSLKQLETAELSRIDIVKELKLIQKKHQQLGKVKFVIPKKITLSHLGFNLNTRVVVESLKRSWKTKCPSCKFVVDSVVLPELTSAYKNESWFIQSSASLPKGRFSAQIIYPQVKTSSSVWVTGQARSQKPILVVARNIEKGEFINSKLFEYKFRDMEKTRGAITDLDGLTYKVTNRYLMSGDIIKSAHLSDKVIFRRGESVQLVYSAGGLNVATSAVSDSIGKVGQSAWVKNIKSNKRIAGTVLATGEVLVK